jgi:hypothetical protein
MAGMPYLALAVVGYRIYRGMRTNVAVLPPMEADLPAEASISTDTPSQE